MNSGVYIIENVVNGRAYVGSAVDIQSRWKDHRIDLRLGRHHSKFLQRAWNKYGPQAFEFRVLLYCDKFSLIRWEQIAINGHLSLLGRDQLYNSSLTAGSTLGLRFKRSAEDNRKKRERYYLNPRPNSSPEARRKLSTVHKGNQYGAGKRSEQACENIRQGVLRYLERRANG